MTEAWKEAKTKIKGIALIPISYITPTKNTFSPITPYADVSDADTAQEPPRDHKDPESDSEEAESDDDDYYPIMKPRNTRRLRT